ncbi:MAG: tetratricopeptide repeat protein [Planctomycetes bacterium]|nr:tetratricopeptide repeat protein [Planctomycetota bacterium]
MTPGRNDPCTCGSGKKYKKCCAGAAPAGASAAAPAAPPASEPSPAERQQLVALFQAGQAAPLESRARALLTRHPESGFLWNVLGAALGMQERDSLGAFQKAARCLPQDADVQSNLGIALAKHGRYAEAEDCQRRALAKKPSHLGAEVNLGHVLDFLGRHAEAEACYRQALRRQPNVPEAHGGLGGTLLKLGRLAEAENHLRRALELRPDFAAAHSSLLFLHNFLPDRDPAAMLAEARGFGAQVARRARPFPAYGNVPDPERRLRIGLVSPDLGAHPVGYFLVGVLSAAVAQAGASFEFFAYAQRAYQDPVSEALRQCCRSWCATPDLGDAALAQRIRDDGIDVLLDLAGHTAENRLPVFAWRPAPVQATWLGYFATTGVAEIDFLLADPWSLPEAEAGHFSERIWYLPETRLCFAPPTQDVPVGELPALAAGQCTFGCFNNLAKMQPQVVATWARVLAAVPGSRLFLKAPSLGDAAVRREVVGRFAAHGIDAARLILESAEARDRYLAAYQRVDIALDPFPFTGATTSVEALWMGVPVLTLAGARLVGRQGVGLLQNVGLPEWIAADSDDYVARAVRHAADLERLAELRRGLRARLLASPLGNAPRFAGHWLAALRGMWGEWCRKQAAGPG